MEAGAGRGPLSDVPAAVAAALKQHPAVEDIHPTGSRAEGRSHDLSDWDFAVATDDFPTVAADLPQLLAPFAPLAQQWDPYASHACYMLLFPGPTKVDLLFLDEPREWSPPWAPSPENLEAIDRHFWDWILWLEQKRRGGKDETLDEGLANMFELMLRPMGATTRPRSIPEALAAYHAARDKLERRYNTTVPRALEREVAPAVSSAG